jgi:DNA-binding beta-propeller fold protein YncE
MRPVLATVALLAGALFLISQQSPRELVGPQPDGSVLLNNGWVLRPAGRQVSLGHFPMASAVSSDGRYLVVLQAGYLQPTLSVFDAAMSHEISRVSVADAWLGLHFAPKSNLLYVGGGSTATVDEFELTSKGKLEKRREFPLVAQADRKHTDFVSDVTLSPDGRLIYAALLYRDAVWVINPQSGRVIEQWKTGHRPYRILFDPDGQSFFVTGWGDGYLYRHNALNGEIIERIALGPAPMDMVWRDKRTLTEEGEDAGIRARLFVALSNTNLVSVVAVDDNKSLRPLERINLSFYPVMPAGITPSGLALSSDSDRLFVACSDANALAVVDVSQVRSRVLGFLPTGWYPTAAQTLPDGTVIAFNGKGARSFPNLHGPNPTRQTAPVYLGNSGVEYVGVMQRGTASVIPPLDDQRLESYSDVVLKNCPYVPRKMEDAGVPRGSVIPSHPGDTSPIEHVIYIIKENRTYDQVLGDLGVGNGDPSLTLFGEEVMPNHHKLARQFILFDNFYVNADVSADGHNWSAAAIAPAYVQRLWPNSYGRRRRHADYEGFERATEPPAGYIWTNVLAKGLSLRNYGWWVTNITPAPASGPQVKEVRDRQLAGFTNLDYRGFDLDYRDVNRVQVFLKDLAQFEASGSMPRFLTLRLGNDHTSGISSKKIAPRSSAADNDYALGLLVEAVSRSRFWPKTAVFVLEDDAQNGPDHVDSHRSVAFIVSPYTSKRGIDSTFYNTVSMLRTMELILGLFPMTVHDAGARPMFAAFNDKPDLAVYSAEKPRISLDERNPENGPAAARAPKFDFEEADLIDDDALNEVLWRALKGTEPPLPLRSYFGR